MRIHQESPEWISLLQYMEEQIVSKRTAGRHSTAEQYRAAVNWLLRFLNTDPPAGTPIVTQSLSPATVDNFVDFLHAQPHLKPNSRKSYLAALRAIYNRAVRDKVIHPSDMPFAGLTLTAGKTVKRAITRQAVEEIASLDLSYDTRLQKAADFALFSYLTSGIPFVDLAHLTINNLQDGYIVYRRQKTGTTVRIRVTEGIRKLIDKYHDPDSPYLFPILSEGHESYNFYKASLRSYNKSLKIIGQLLSTPVFLTSYVIRHTWATEALRQHIPVAIISQALGHTSEKTTRCYLAELDQSELNDANAVVIASVEEIIRRRA